MIKPKRCCKEISKEAKKMVETMKFAPKLKKSMDKKLLGE
jgi:hypothetical protein